MTSTEATVDIILPTHAHAHTIGCAIQAVLEQTHARFALHVVGDGCSDATAAAVEAVADPRLRFHRLPKARGYGYANRNRVLAAADGEFVAYASDDDLWFPDHLAVALAALERDALELVATRSVHVNFPDGLDPHLFALDWRRPAAPTDLLRNWFISAPTLVHRRRVLERVGAWDDHLARFGDREFFNRVRRALPTAYVDVPTVLRFYALHWEHQYRADGEAPQARYLPRLRDAAWRDAVRAAAMPGPRPLSVRARQWRDFARFALRSGPKLLRFWYESLRSMPRRERNGVAPASLPMGGPEGRPSRQLSFGGALRAPSGTEARATRSSESGEA